MARKPMVRRPWGLPLKYDMHQQLWETNDDNGVIYHLPHGLLDDLKNHYKYNHKVEQWYKELDKEDRKKVKRTNFTDDSPRYNDGDFIE